MGLASWCLRAVGLASWCLRAVGFVLGQRGPPQSPRKEMDASQCVPALLWKTRCRGQTPGGRAQGERSWPQTHAPLKPRFVLPWAVSFLSTPEPVVMPYRLCLVPSARRSPLSVLLSGG